MSPNLGLVRISIIIIHMWGKSVFTFFINVVKLLWVTMFHFDSGHYLWIILRIRFQYSVWKLILIIKRNLWSYLSTICMHLPVSKNKFTMTIFFCSAKCLALESGAFPDLIRKEWITVHEAVIKDQSEPHSKPHQWDESFPKLERKQLINSKLINWTMNQMSLETLRLW